jgi:MFS family permease
MLLTLGELVSNLGSKITYIALLTKVLELSGSPLKVGIVALLGTVPTVIFAPIAGVAADRLSRKTIVVASNLIRAGMSLGLIFAVHLPQIYGLTLADAVIASFFAPARQALEPSLVRRDQLLQMNSFNQVLKNFVQVGGPMAAGLTVAALGYSGAFVFNSLTFLVAATTAALIRTRQQSETAASATPTRSMAEPAHSPDGVDSRMRPPVSTTGVAGARTWREFLAGWQYARENSVLMYVFTLQLFITLAISMQGTLLFLYADRYLQSPGHVAQRAGFLYSMVGVGGLLGGIILNFLLRWIKRIPLLLAVLTLDGVAVLGFALNTNFYVAMLICALFGMMGVALSSTANTILQEETPEILRGRVFALFGSAMGPASLLSIGMGAGLASLFGPRLVFLGAGFAELTFSAVSTAVPTYSKVKSR